jgi:hypothetical protein
MLDFINLTRNGLNLKISVEIEKIDQGHEVLISLADLVFLSKDFAQNDIRAESASEVINLTKDKLRAGKSS